MHHDASNDVPVDLGPAALQLKALLPGVSNGDLDAPTPCANITVGALLDHLVGLTRAFRDAARKSSIAASEPPAPVAANLTSDWRDRLPAQLAELVAAWREPVAWTGTTEAGGVTLPGSVAGVIALDELVIHGWDLARSTGQPFECDPASAAAILPFLTESASEEGQPGLFGPMVHVPTDAPLLERLVGLSGRDPAWTPESGSAR